jgi:hypothetical protein
MKAAWKCPNTCHQPIGEETYFPAAIGKNVAISIPFLLRAVFLFTFIKSQRNCEKCVKCSVALFLFLLFPTIPLFARLELVRQSLKKKVKKGLHRPLGGRKSYDKVSNVIGIFSITRFYPRFF